MKPLLVIAVGRSGTTYFNTILSQHPDIVAHRSYPMEFSPFLSAVFPEDAILRGSTTSAQYAVEEAEALLSPLKRLDRLPFENVKPIYSILAKEKRPQYFVEKFHPRLDINTVCKVAPDAKFICLVRDPRDVLLSARAFDQKRGYRGFRERDGDTDEEVVLKYKQVFDMLVSAEKLSNALIVHYEMLIADSNSCLQRVFKYLDLDASLNTFQTCISGGSNIPVDHITSPNNSSSEARWKGEMNVNLRGLYETHLGEVLQHFGYAE